MSKRRYLSLLMATLLVASGAIGAARAASDPNEVFSNRQTAALAQAVSDNDLSAIRDLAQHGANLADQGEAGVTVLQWAMLRDRPDAVALLADLGADPAERGYDGQTALHMAAMARDKPYLQILLDHGADPNVRGGPREGSVLSEALMDGNSDAVLLLLAHHADPNVTDRQDDTPLHVAAQISDYANMLALLEAGADPTLRNKQGKTFAAYFAIHPKESIMSDDAKAARGAVQQWLDAHGYSDAKQ
ncbi:MAG TPA: ankyrin repeat domain-containing protein [Devosiaceae bacterium]|jgi:hypothetical protein